MTEQQFTSQELAKLKAADPDGVISVRVEQIAELIEQKGRLIEQKGRLIEQKGRLIEQNEQLIQQNKQLLAKDVRSEEEKAEYRSKIASLSSASRTWNVVKN